MGGWAEEGPWAPDQAARIRSPAPQAAELNSFWASHPPTGVREEGQAETCHTAGLKSCLWHLKACGAPWVIEIRGAVGKCLKARAEGMKAAELQAASTVGGIMRRDRGWEETHQAWWQ